MKRLTDYSKKFNKKAFWEKVKKYAAIIGKKVLNPVLILYYCYQDPNTPKMTKTIIAGALGYFIWPIDAIIDITPLIGYSDDFGAVMLAMGLVALHIKPIHRKMADDKLSEWF